MNFKCTSKIDIDGKVWEQKGHGAESTRACWSMAVGSWQGLQVGASAGSSVCIGSGGVGLMSEIGGITRDTGVGM